MWQSRNKKLKNRKSSLQRNLRQDVSNLSSTSRADSPLPDLIIEREKYRHDEPDEFYQELEVKMIKLYKKLFHGFDDNPSEVSYSLIDLDDDYNVLEQNVSEDNLIEIDSSEMSWSNVSLEVVHDTSMESEEFIRTMRSSSSTRTRAIVNTGQGHREPTNDDREDFNSIKDRLVVTQARTDQEIKIETEKEEDFIFFEIMRQGTRKIKSLGSILEGTTPEKKKKRSVTPIAVGDECMSHVQNVESLPPTAVDSDSSNQNSSSEAINRTPSPILPCRMIRQTKCRDVKQYQY